MYELLNEIHSPLQMEEVNRYSEAFIRKSRIAALEASAVSVCIDCGLRTLARVRVEIHKYFRGLVSRFTNTFANKCRDLVYLQDCNLLIEMTTCCLRMASGLRLS